MMKVCELNGGVDTLDSIVIGLPGRIDYGAGKLQRAPNLPSRWTDDLSAAKLGETYGAPVFLANDADLAAVGESYFGAGVPYRDMVYVTISTGMGSGIVFDGNIQHGRCSLGEIGHTVIALDRLIEDSPATAEELGAGPALDRYAAKLGLEERGAQIVSVIRRGGDDRARRAWDTTIHAAGTAIVNLAHLFSPEAIVIGGGVGRNGKLVSEPIEQMLKTFGSQGFQEPIVVVEASLQDMSGIVGGAAWPTAIGALP